MILTAGILLGACSNDNEPANNEVAAVFTTNLDSRVQTRMADNEWATDDAIGIFSLNDEMEGVSTAGAAQSNKAENMKYVRTIGDGWSGGFRFKNPASPVVTFKAYYPHTEDVTADGTISFDAADQTAAGQAKFDFLFANLNKEGATSTGSKNNPNVSFQFTHSMSKVIIVLKADGTTVTSLGTMNPTLYGLKTKGTFSLADGAVALADDATDTDLKLKNQTGSNPATQQTFVAIVPPQSAPTDAYLAIATEGSDSYLSAKILGSQALVAGKSYTITITVKKLELQVESSGITAWTPNDSAGSADAILQ